MNVFPLLPRSTTRWSLLFAASLFCQHALAQPAVFNPENGHWYAAIQVEDVISWDNAKSAAESLLLGGVPGHLVTLTSQPEQDFVAAAFPLATTDGYWLGGFQSAGQADPAAGWSWVTGEPWDFTFWAPGSEPNDFGGVDETVLAFHGFLGTNPSGFWNDGQPFTAPGYVVEWEDADSDGDGIPDVEDACPGSNLTATVMIDGCDSGVSNGFVEPGCTIADRIAECAANAANHDEFVSCVAHLTNALRKNNIISEKDKGPIQRCAGQSNLP